MALSSTFAVLLSLLVGIMAQKGQLTKETKNKRV
jgi:hypothetical protein